MALIATQTVTIAGTAPTLASAAGGDTAPCGDRLFLVCKNINAASRTVTLATPGNLPTGDAYPDKVYTLAADTGELWIPLLPVYRDPSTNSVAITWSATTGVTRAVVRV